MANTNDKKGKLAASAQLTKAAWRTLKLDKELLVASLMSVLTSIVLFAAFIAAFIFVIFPNYPEAEESSSLAADLVYYGVVAVYLFVTYVAANYFSGAIAHAALQRFRGNNPTLKGSLQAASQKFGPLVAFSALQATVGLVLNILSDRLPFAGKIATWLAGAAWGIATMFAIPLIMDNKETRPLRAVRASAKTFTNIWGESIFIGIGLGILEVVVTVFMVFILVGAIGLSIAFSTWIFGLVGAALFVLGLVLIGIVLSTLRTIVMTAAYYYASTQQLPAGFDDELIRSMFRPKASWLK